MPVTIMIVDDSPTMLMSLEGVLTKQGFGVVKAASGEQALATLTAGTKPALLITDLNMGAMNGIELIRKARQLPGFRFVPMLMLTTESQQDKRAEAKAAGATGWLVKPVAPDALLGVIKQVVPGS
ncbi:MAG: response regulator [Alphaproteobacteria bacterium]|nr:response regulator [Alphaproteobacteria bacterium]